jgi:hypothetical protein
VADRRDCNAMRGTPYNSETERAWFLANCSAPVTTTTANTTTAAAPPAQAPRFPTTGQLPPQAYTIQASTLCGLPIGAVDQSLQALHKQICGN